MSFLTVGHVVCQLYCTVILITIMQIVLSGMLLLMERTRLYFTAKRSESMREKLETARAKSGAGAGIFCIIYPANK